MISEIINVIITISKSIYFTPILYFVIIELIFFLWYFPKFKKMYNDDVKTWNNGICAKSGNRWRCIDSIYGFAVYSDDTGNEFCPCDVMQSNIRNKVYG